MLKNFFDLNNDKTILPPEVRDADNLSEVLNIARDQIDLEMESRNFKTDIDGWDDDANNVSDDRLKRAVKWTIAYKMSDIVFRNTDRRKKAEQIGPKRVRFDQNAKRDFMQFVRPFAEKNRKPIWSLH